MFNHYLRSQYVRRDAPQLRRDGLEDGNSPWPATPTTARGGCMIRRWSIPLATAGLALGSLMALGGTASAAVAHPGADGAYKSVSASWKEPAATCSGRSDQYAAFWVGLDGYSSDSVEQTGTDSDCDGRTPSYYGWYEMYPADPVYFSNTVKPGDSLSASVKFSGTDTYTLVLKDSTEGW